MAFSVEKGVYSDRNDFLTKAKAFLDTNGWTTAATDAANGEFVCFSDASGQDTTENIEIGFERIWLGFTTFDGGNEVKLQSGTYVDNIGGTPASPSDMIGFFGVGASTLGKCFDDGSAGDYIINTDGAPGKGGTWVGVWTSGSSGLYCFGGNWAMFNFDRAVRNVSTLVGNVLTLASTPPKRWNPANFGGASKYLEISQQGGSGVGTVERIEVVSISGNALTLNASPTFTFNSNAKVGDWMHTRALMDSTNADGGNVDYQTVGDFDSAGTANHSVIEIAGSDETEGDPNIAQNAFEAASVGVYDDTNSRGLLFQVHPASAMIVPKGSLVAGTDSLQIPNRTRTGFLKYEIRTSASSTNFYWAIRTA